MPRESKFEAVKLRTLVTEGKTAQQVMDAFGINKTTLKAYLLKLMQMDEKFYKIEGMGDRAVSGNVKFGTMGVRLSPTLLGNFGFTVGDEFKVSCLEEGKIVLEKKWNI
ncbi:ArsR family transcriptional regulator [Solidesulfovibrio sp.]